MTLQYKILFVCFILVMSMPFVSAFTDGVETLPADEITSNSATFTADLFALVSDNGTAFFQYTYEGSGWVNTSDTVFMNSTGQYSIQIDDLEPDTTYVYRGVFDGDVFITAFNEEMFTTPKETVNEKINNTKSIIFMGFALLVLILFSLLVMTLLAVINQNAGISDILSIVIYVIGGTIVLFVGYIIVGNVVGHLL